MILTLRILMNLWLRYLQKRGEQTSEVMTHVARYQLSASCREKEYGQGSQ